MAREVVTVFGGSGFVGRHVVKRLVEAGVTVRVAVRDAEAARFIKTYGEVGQVIPICVNITKDDEVRAAVAGTTGVVNAVGILAPFGRQTFSRIHVDGAANIAKAAADAGVSRLVHISALGADADSLSRYAKTKADGEAAVRDAYPAATIMRPSVIFGPDDDFFNRFGALARYTPVLPVFGCPTLPRVDFFPDGEDGQVLSVDLYGDGGTRFQPVYVGDVASAVVSALRTAGSTGQTFELGGPRSYSFKEVMDMVLHITGRKRILAPVPFGLAKIPAWFLEFLPVPPLTRDQIILMQSDNVVSEGAKTLADLGVAATGVEAVVPAYLKVFRAPSQQGHTALGH